MMVTMTMTTTKTMTTTTRGTWQPAAVRERRNDATIEVAARWERAKTTDDDNDAGNDVGDDNGGDDGNNGNNGGDDGNNDGGGGDDGNNHDSGNDNEMTTTRRRQRRWWSWWWRRRRRQKEESDNQPLFERGMMRQALARQERWRRIERDDDDGDIDDGEKDDHKINSKSTFRPPQSRKGTTTYSACILGVRLRYRRHGEHVVTELKRE
jgi:hypothetical protein